MLGNIRLMISEEGNGDESTSDCEGTEEADSDEEMTSRGEDSEGIIYSSVSTPNSHVLF